MIEHRVARLRVRVRAPASASPSVRDVATGLVCAVIERACELLEAEAPGRVVLVRRLPLAWRLGLAGLDDRATVERLARAVADGIAPQLPPAWPAVVPDADHEVAVFDDDLDWAAASLIAVATARPAWWQRPVESDEDVWNVIAAPASRDRVLARLVERDVIEDVLAQAPPRVLAQVAEALIVAPPHGVAARADVARATAIARIIEHARSLGTRMPHVVAEPRVAQVRRETPSSATPAEAAPANDAGEADAAPLRVGTVEHGGLFYLLGLVLELGIGEGLWKACLPEGAWLARVAHELTGAPAAVEWFAGTPVAELAADPAQQEELARAVLDELAAAIPRRGLADLPTAHLRVVDTAGTRLAVATPADQPFVLYAHPVSSPRDAQDAIATFAARWPARLTASRTLAELDRRLTVAAAPCPAHLVDVGSPPATALASQLTGALAALFAARTGETFATLDALARRHLALPATLVDDGERITIELPMASIDLAVRRAGLDRDPGWVPWLERTVRFAFVGGDDDV